MNDNSYDYTCGGCVRKLIKSVRKKQEPVEDICGYRMFGKYNAFYVARIHSCREMHSLSII